MQRGGERGRKRERERKYCLFGNESHFIEEINISYIK